MPGKGTSAPPPICQRTALFSALIDRAIFSCADIGPGAWSIKQAKRV
jgi:hypothetical protein